MLKFDLRVGGEVDAFTKLIASLQFQGATFTIEQNGMIVMVNVILRSKK